MFATTHKHLKTIVMVATRSLDDKGWVIVGGFGLRLLRVVFLLSLWRTLLPESGEVSGMTQIRDAVSVLLSGAIIPLALMPWGIGDVLVYLPFASLASAPLRIYTGTGDPFFLIGLQAFWVVILWPVAHLLWNANRERLVSHGG